MRANIKSRINPQSAIRNPRSSNGFTLAEMVIVIAITGILGGMIALLLKGPVQGYVDSARRAELNDIADTALHRLTRDVRLALPNSVRVRNAAGTSCSGTEICYLEYLEMVAGGRYNTNTTPCFNTASMVLPLSSNGVSCLTTIGDLVGGATNSTSSVLANGRGSIGASAVVVINNQYNNSVNNCATLPASSVYCGIGYGNATITMVTNSGVNADEDVISFASAVFPSSVASNNHRFQVVNTPVTYVCDPGAGTLTRYWGYAIQSTQPNSTTVAPLSTASSAVLATHVSHCNFVISSIVESAAQSAVLVTMPLTITEAGINEPGESVSIYGTAYVSSESGIYGAANGSLP